MTLPNKQPFGVGSGGGSQPGDVITGSDVDASLAANLPSTPSAGALHRISVGGDFEGSTDIEPVGFVFEVGDYIHRNALNTKWNPIAGNTDINNDAYGAGWSGDVTDAPSRDAVYNEMETRLKNTSNLGDLTNTSTARTNIGLGNVDNTSDADKPVSTAQQTALDAKLSVISNLADLSNFPVARSNLGLGSVDNTSDADKPVSTAQQAAIDAVDEKTLEWVVAGATPQSAVAGQGYFVDTSSAAYTVNLPTTPSAGDTVGVSDFKGNAATNNITVARNGELIDGDAEDLIVNLDKASFKLVFSDALTGWVIIDFTQGA